MIATGGRWYYIEEDDFDYLHKKPCESVITWTFEREFGTYALSKVWSISSGRRLSGGFQESNAPLVATLSCFLAVDRIWKDRGGEGSHDEETKALEFVRDMLHDNLVGSRDYSKESTEETVDVVSDPSVPEDI